MRCRVYEVVEFAVGLLEFGVAAAQFFLGAFASGNVAHDLRCTDDRAVAVEDRRDGERDVEQRAVFTPPHRFEMRYTPSAADPVENHTPFGLTIFGNQER